MFGLDLLGAAEYGKVALDSLPQGWALGIFDNTFGDATPVVIKALKRHCPLVRVQMLWSDAHTFGDGDIPKIKQIAKKYEAIAKRFPNSKIQLSPFCEHNLQNPDKYLDIVKNNAPSCTPVNTIWLGAKSKKYKNEVHGELKAPKGAYNFSFDGTNCVDSDVEKFKSIHSNSEVFFFWHPRFNLKWSMGDTTPRHLRTAVPTKELIESVVYLHTKPGKINVPEKWLIKSHAERHGADDLKGDKLLIISPIKTSALKLKYRQNLTETLPYYGPFEGGGYRYYSSKFGYKFGSNVEVWADDKKRAICNPGFRAGYFR